VIRNFSFVAMLGKIIGGALILNELRFSSESPWNKVIYVIFFMVHYLIGISLEDEEY
jgi:hypothetical protein